MVALEAQETTKICSTRIELEQLKGEYDTKLRDLNLRIQVSAVLEEDTKDTSKQLDAALSDNFKLQEKVRKLEHILRGVRDNSNILTIPPHVEAPVHPSDPSRESSTSLSSSIVDVKDSQKRDLSPTSQLKRNGPAKKPKSEIWHTWNRNGTRVVTAWGVDALRIILHGMAKPDLVALLAKASAAAENFESVFPLDNDPEEGIRHRNAEPHSAFQSLQTELKIPSIAEGRAFSLQFYYSKVFETIHDVLVRRDNFTKHPDDADKIHTYIAHRGANHPDVVASKLADDQHKYIDRNASGVRVIVCC